jgi:opacity protein-like surface antigen
MTAGARPDWWNGFVGARVLLPFAARWSIVGYADTGAEGSDLTWQALAAVNYHLSPTISAKLGYRYLSAIMRKVISCTTSYDMDTSGLFLGVGIRF